MIGLVFHITSEDMSATVGHKCNGTSANPWKWPPLLVTSPHGVTLWTEKHWRLAYFESVFKVAVDFFRKN